MSISKISPELFHKLVGLAALELLSAEGAYLLTEMNHQLSSVNALLQVPLEDDIQPTPSAGSRSKTTYSQPCTESDARGQVRARTSGSLSRHPARSWLVRRKLKMVCSPSRM